MQSKTDIANMALGHLGHSKPIANIDTDRSAEGNAVRTFFDISLKETLRDFAWPVASKYRDLDLVEENPNTEWGYSYRYPSDCVTFKKIISGKRQDTTDSKIEYEIGGDDQGSLIFTDQPEAVGKYTKFMDNTALFPVDLVMALSFRLAAHIAPSVTGGDPYKMGSSAMTNYLFYISRAQATALNEEQPGKQNEAESIRGRD